MFMWRRLQRFMPDPERLRRLRVLRWLGPAIHHPRLWHTSRRGVALGLALGVFFGLLIPVAQIPLAAGFAVLMRANLPAAVGSTLVSNPVTFAPLYYVAYRIGAAILGEPPMISADELRVEAGSVEDWVQSWSQRLKAMGKPLMLGLLVIASVLSVAVYVLVQWIWRMRTRRAWRHRRVRRARARARRGEAARP